MDYHIQINLHATDRRAVRLEVLQQFIAEEPGTREEKNRYIYHAETLTDGSRIILKRPAWKNKGIDFEIWCENFSMNGRQARPSHSDIFEEIQTVLTNHPDCREELFTAIRRVWECENPAVVLQSLNLLRLDPRVERLLKLVRWLFIEQDLTYWIASGRWMLRTAIEERFGQEF